MCIGGGNPYKFSKGFILIVEWNDVLYQHSQEVAIYSMWSVVLVPYSIGKTPSIDSPPRFERQFGDDRRRISHMETTNCQNNSRQNELTCTGSRSLTMIFGNPCSL